MEAIVRGSLLKNSALSLPKEQIDLLENFGAIWARCWCTGFSH